MPEQSRYWKWRVIIAVNFPIEQSEGRSLENIRASTDSNPWPPQNRCVTRPTELWSHTLENLLRWSLFTFIYNRSTKWISYIFHVISLHGKIWTQQIDLAPTVWLHSVAKIRIAWTYYLNLIYSVENTLYLLNLLIYAPQKKAKTC